MGTGSCPHFYPAKLQERQHIDVKCLQTVVTVNRTKLEVPSDSGKSGVNEKPGFTEQTEKAWKTYQSTTS
jgi:hypothetical protein